MSSEYDPRITAYFGNAVMRAGFMPIPHLFMRHYRQLGLSSTQAMFLLQVMESAWDLAAPPRTVGDLARRMDVDPRTIRKYSEEIARLQLLHLYDQYDASGAQIENGYDLAPLFNRLSELAPERPPSTTFRRRSPITPVEQQAAGTSSPMPQPKPENTSAPGSFGPPPGGSFDPA